MIHQSDVFLIGKLLKPHGIHGEISFAFTKDIFENTPSPYLILDMDGILVPFFVETFRYKTAETALVKFERINSEIQVRALCHKSVYFPIKYAGEQEVDMDDWNSFIGYEVIDEVHGRIGQITQIDDSTLNVLFEIQKDGVSFLMPVAEEFFTSVDPDTRVMHVALPEGLLDI
jgi:16S rRNA processing protein RimM